MTTGQYIKNRYRKQAKSCDSIHRPRRRCRKHEDYLIVTNGGLTFTGILASDSATSVTLRREKGASETILRTDIETMEASNVSMMPSNVHDEITPEDAADLIAYLREALSPSRPNTAKN